MPRFTSRFTRPYRHPQRYGTRTSRNTPHIINQAPEVVCEARVMAIRRCQLRLFRFVAAFRLRR